MDYPLRYEGPKVLTLDIVDDQTKGHEQED
jgi:hypothetical protein